MGVTSDFEISLSVQSLDKKNSRNFYNAEKRIISELSRISIPNFKT